MHAGRWKGVGGGGGGVEYWIFSIKWSTVIICNCMYLCILSFFLLIYSLSLDLDKYQWTGIGDEEATALADPRVIKNFKTLE